MEAVTLHRRFPYAVLVGFFFLDKDAAQDGTDRRRSTFHNAHSRLRLFTGRSDPAGRDEQYERLYLVLVDASPFKSTLKANKVDEAERAIGFEAVFDEIVELVADRNPDFYECRGGVLHPVPH